MKVVLADFIRDTPAGEEAADILGRCVHCGFCNAVCPTYQLLGDERDGPRGRIYLIKSALEGHQVSARTQQHLDRCLTCLACEANCPSGVEYHRLLAIGRQVVDLAVPRRAGEAWLRRILCTVVPRPRLFAALTRVGRLVRPLLPAMLAGKLPMAAPANRLPHPVPGRHSRRMLLLSGCAQPTLAPNINAATGRVLDRLGVECVEIARAGCCGAVQHHLGDQEGACADARRNIDAWWPEIESGAEAIIVTASGCTVHVRDYGHLLAHDPDYAAKASRIAALARDPVEVLLDEGDGLLTSLEARRTRRGRLAFHVSCTLQHGLKAGGKVEAFLRAAGFELMAVADGHLCCGSAGAYALLQPQIANQLRERKQIALMAGRPLRIATANVGCLNHLQAISAVPVVHWIELIDEVLK